MENGIGILACIDCHNVTGCFPFSPTTDPAVWRLSLSIATMCSIVTSAGVSQVISRYHDLIIEKNHTLATYAQDLSKANAELEAFARTVAHDLKSPISNL